MPASDPDKAIQRGIFALLVVLTVFLAYVLASDYGAAIPRVLHWTGVVLLLAGISMAAKGISDVRREWTQRPGIAGYLRQQRTRASGEFWRWWNWLAGHERIARVLRIRRHGKDVTIELPPAVLRMGVPPVTMTVGEAPPSKGTLTDRVAWLEQHMMKVDGRLLEFDSRLGQEAADRARALQAEEQARERADHAIRVSIVNLAGGGLRLQVWGVACLLAGTVLSGFW